MNEIVHGEVIEAGQIVRRNDAPAHSPIVPRVTVNIRSGTMADVPFVDRMQKAHSRALGFLPTKAIEGKIKLGHVLVAEVPSPPPSPGVPGEGVKAIGYLIAADRYQKRDEIGYVTQINVLPEYRRSLVAASLLQAQFDRSAYGCRLYCCWCAQDLVSANEFWEAMGFVAIAFRTGSRTRGQRSEIRGQKRARIHIFWQKRIRASDEGAGATPWWYPSTTGGGELREDRLVFPIPPGVSWRDVLPVVLTDERSEVGDQRSEKTQKKPRAKRVLKAPILKGGLWFAHQAIVEKVEPAKDDASVAKAKIDPRLTKLARELRDRWTERAGAGLILPQPAPAKHDVRRMIAPDAQPTPDALIAPAPLIPALPEAA